MKIFKVLILSVLLCMEMYSSSFNVTDIENKINVVAFVTSWCPVCVDVTNFLEKICCTK